MDHLQDFLTLVATVIEYFFFAYLAVAFMVYSLKPLKTDKPIVAAEVSRPYWEQSVDPSTALVGMAG